jgi:endonuclease/exonuclease/phosphatase (EEP) superfamily protein YafD
MAVTPRLRRILDRSLTRACWTVAPAGYLLSLFARGWPSDFASQSLWRALLDWIAFMSRTFEFHLGLVALLLLTCAVLSGRRWLAFALTPLAALNLWAALQSYAPRTPAPIAGERISLMSVNLLKRNYKTGPLIEEIRAAAPDVVAFQEYTSTWHARLSAEFGETYPYQAGLIREDSYGAAIYSRRPFLEPPTFDTPLGRGGYPQMGARLELNGEPLTLYDLHLRSPGSLGSVIEQRAQFADLQRLLSSERGPCVVAGDFNATNESAFLQALLAIGYADAHSLAGWGRGATWPVRWGGRWLPGIRLDHILLNSALSASQSWTGVGAGSDHRPVGAVLGRRALR